MDTIFLNYQLCESVSINRQIFFIAKLVFFLIFFFAHILREERGTKETMIIFYSKGRRLKVRRKKRKGRIKER